jgi:hypothetical protein
LVVEIDGRGLAVARGYRDTVGMLSVSRHLSAGEAKRRVAQATTAMPVVGAASAAGAITPEHVAGIHRVLVQAPATVEEVVLEQAEKTLVALAAQAPPAAVRKGRAPVAELLGCGG